MSACMPVAANATSFTTFECLRASSSWRCFSRSAASSGSSSSRGRLRLASASLRSCSRCSAFNCSRLSTIRKARDTFEVVSRCICGSSWSPSPRLCSHIAMALWRRPLYRCSMASPCNRRQSKWTEESPRSRAARSTRARSVFGSATVVFSASRLSRSPRRRSSCSSADTNWYCSSSACASLRSSTPAALSVSGFASSFICFSFCSSGAPSGAAPSAGAGAGATKGG
mmetsp:Transcript_119/g.426  ORF Transcript_119/g.426 Transcript_119/m.426 type:complete len:227 (-) Transcript_119:526-1206(-)